MNQEIDGEIDEVEDDAISSDSDFETAQRLPKSNKPKPLKKGYSPPKYYSDVDIKPFCHHCHERHKVEAVEQVVKGTK